MKKIIIISALVLFTAAACNSNSNQPNSQTPTPPPVATPNPTPAPAPVSPTPAPMPTPPPVSAPTTHNVSIQNFAFSSPSVTIKKGDTVMWINKDSMAHTVTGDNGGPASGNIGMNQAYSFTFKTAGTFAYHCAIHPYMKGTVIVQ
jgi:amicyanin